MTRLALIGILVGAVLSAGCGGTYKHIEVEYPISPYTKYKALNLEIISPEGTDKDDLKSFKELIISTLQKKGGITIVGDKKFPVLTVEVVKFFKDSRVARNIGTVALWMLVPAPPLDLYTSNAIEVKVSIKGNKGEILNEFKEFEEFKEKIKDWEDLRRTVANRIADAVYFAH